MADVSEVQERIVARLNEWLAERPPRVRKDIPNANFSKKTNNNSKQAKQAVQVETKTAVCVGLILCQKLKHKYPLIPSDVDTGGGQVPGLSARNVHTILKRHGIIKKYAEETGRTTRGSTNKARSLVERLAADPDFRNLMTEERAKVVDAMEIQLIERVRAYFSRQKLAVAIDLTKPGPSIVADILRAAAEKKLGGPVAQHLVGAKLAYKFPNKNVDNFGYTAADAHLNRDGDFTLEDTAFHVTVAPMIAHLQKCRSNVAQGRKPYLIVPAEQMQKARAYAEAEKVEEKVAIVSLEQFVGQNVDEMGEFGQNKTRGEIAEVLKEYNRRVTEAETDQSIQIVIPKNIEPNP